MRDYDDYGVKRGPYVVPLAVVFMIILPLLFAVMLLGRIAVRQTVAKLDAQAALSECVAPVVVAEPSPDAIQDSESAVRPDGCPACPACPEQAATAEWVEKHCAQGWRLAEPKSLGKWPERPQERR